MVTTYTGNMDWQLGCRRARVLGSLLEKEIATPDYYPLSTERAGERLQPEIQPRAGGFL